MRNSLATILATGLLTTSCSFIPALDPINSPVSGKFPGKTGGEVPGDIAWQKFFTDPRLKKLVQAALENNRDLRIAALNVEQARAQYGISRSDLFPTIYAGASTERRRSVNADGGGGSASGNYDVSVGLSSYELDLFGRVRSLNRSALESYFGSDAARVGAQISLVAQIANQYLAERALHEQVALSEQSLEGFNSAYDIVKQRFDAGAISELDLSSIEVQRQTAKADLAAFRQRIQEVNNSLTFLCGGSLPANLPAGRSLDEILVANVRAGVPSELLFRRPDIREAEHQLRAANANIGAARAAFFPSITLTTNVGAASNSLSNLFSNGTATWLFSPAINVPIFDGGRNKANLDVAEIRKEIEIANYEKSIQTGFREVADSLASRTGLDEQISATQSLVKAQQKRADLSKARYTQGVDSYFEVLTATLDYYTAQQSLIRLRLARNINSVGLYKALGGGW
ncbi:efflux transporter outer membrane subunit [Luteolibacter yonseiensis]|uniref:Efflux transporter outer membrane subunit n=1 Tax=Luteolibacter yonseiensis TaxID=1144680 RepID=A0A934VAZ0_9BACT|nr:efflux transporter outer membrane subunit [Luteolibacter yonseiensis]MBK1814854.1 efflux transporter outer membrane subunit [Luteolibacter yonseiensis]